MLDTEIANLKITITTTVTVEKKSTVISDLGLKNENVKMISEMLKEATK
ncbi:hypothetical protein FACS1894132_14840 [Clostridia bacterium]|nr:hypothetical protein FACS1894132_14840 [Clostridia bacterium]